MRRLPAHLLRPPDLVLHRLPVHPETGVVLRSRKHDCQQGRTFILWTCLLINTDAVVVKEPEGDKWSEEAR